MSLKIAIQMDPVERIDPDSRIRLLSWRSRPRRADSSCIHYLPRDLTLAQGKLTAKARPLKASRDRRPALDARPGPSPSISPPWT